MPRRGLSRAATAISPLAIWAAPLALTFIATPEIVRQLGPVQYGAYSLASAIAAFAVVPSGQAALAHFAAGRTLRNSLPGGLIGTIGLVLLAAVALNIAMILMVEAAFGLQVPTASAGAHLVWIASFSAMLLGTAFSQLLATALQLIERWRIAAIILLIGGMALPLAAYLLAHGSAGWLQIVAVQGMLSLATAGALAWAYSRAYSRAHTSATRNPAPEPPATSTGAIGRYMLHAGAAGAIGAMIALSERLTLSSAFGPAEVGYFALAMTLAGLIHAAMVNANMRLPALLSMAMQEGGAAAQERCYRTAMRLTLAATALAVTLIMALGATFLRLWLGDATGEAVAPLLPWLACGMGGLALAVPPWCLAQVRGEQRFNGLLMLGLGAIWLATLAVFSSHPSPSAVAIARAASAIAVIPYVIAVERAAFGRFPAREWAAMLAAAAVSALVAAVSALVAAGIPLLLNSGTWAGIVLAGAAASAAFLLAGRLTGLFIASDAIWTARPESNSRPGPN